MVAPSWIRRAVLIVAAAACLLLVLVVRVVVSARAELSQAELADRRGDTATAIVHYRRAARWYAPFSPYHVHALERLGQLGSEAEARGDVEQALQAYRAQRGAIMATRSVYVPERELLEQANRRISSLMAELPPPGMDAGKSKRQLQREHLLLLEKIPGPSLGWTCVLLLGFACWVGAAFAFSVRAIDSQDRWVVREARVWGALIVVGFGLFVLGMSMA